MNTLIYSSSILTAFLGGILALFAPCCIVSLLPTYVAATLRVGRWRLLELTGAFAMGVAVVLLPIVLGVGALGQLMGRYHREVFFLGGMLMLALGLAALAGRSWSLPMPTMRAPGAPGNSVAGVLLLGIFSGAVSSCCAPVLGGVLVLSALSSSFWHALGLGVAYVLGMVFPLLLAALLWDRLSFARRSLNLRPVTLSIRGRQMRVRATDLCAGILFLAMGLLMIGLALTGRATYTPKFLLAFNRWGSDRLATLADRLGWVPDWAFALALLGLLLLAAFLVWPRRRGVAAAGAGHPIMPGDSDQHSDHVPNTGRQEEAGGVAGASASRSA
jgi:cytochrome c biogenesis protein CcdA